MSEKSSPGQTTFPAATSQDWMQAVDKVLKGKSFQTLVTKDIGGLERQPLYTEETASTCGDPAGLPGFAPFIRGTQAVNDRYLPWHIVARFEPGRKHADNTDVLTDLNGGVSALLVDVTDTGTDAAAIEGLLAGVDLSIAPLLLRPGAAAEDAIELFFKLLSNSEAATIAAHLDYDPIGMGARKNTSIDISGLAALADQVRMWPHITMLTASGMVYHNSGADHASELAYAMASLIVYINALTESGLSAHEALSNITLTLSTDTDFFAGIAKMRAARALWSQICTAYGVEGLAPKIHAEGSQRSYSVADPWVNILRATIATLGAGIGGADFISVAPCTAVSDGDSLLTRRVARNTQIILQEESHIGRVTDPAGGSWYIENLSRELAETAWALFQDIHKAGGMVKALTSGMVAEHLSGLQNDMDEAVAHRRAPLLGVTEFPNLGEAPLPPRAGSGDGPLMARRPASVFEEMRLAALPVKPKVFLATLGTEAQFTGRANFTANLFAAGGIDALIGSGGEDVAAIAAEFRDSGAKIAVICGSDDAYDTHAEAVAKALHQTGATHLWLAGKQTLSNADNLFMGCNALTVLQTAHQKLGLGE
ncbi:MAG: methylmalonyl-CoA mutase family protein [Parvibaculales bacterium]